MAINDNGIVKFNGAVIDIYDKWWADGMYEKYAVVWNDEQNDIKKITIGYYGSDNCNLCGNVKADIDLSVNNARKILKYYKNLAVLALPEFIRTEKMKIDIGDNVKVVRGRKIPKGTIMQVLWLGEKPTFRARQAQSWSSFKNETELIAKCKDSSENIVFIKAEYLKRLSNDKIFGATDRKKFVNDFVNASLEKYRNTDILSIACKQK